MSLIIKGMKLPQSCSTCRFSYFTVGIRKRCEISGDEVNPLIDRRETNCPLIEIPTPHGRLIDADTVEERLQKYWYEEYPNQEASYHRAFMDSNACVKDLPTIIEAEVTSDGEV